MKFSQVARCRTALLALAVCFGAAYRLSAATVVTGDVTPALPWTAATTVRIGNTGSGTLAVNSGDQLVSFDARLASTSGSQGIATLTDPGTFWNTQVLTVGMYGNGFLSIQSGAQVGNNTAYLGYHAGADGAVTLSGAGSKWEMASGLYVGLDGHGTLQIEDGALVTTDQSYLGYNTGAVGIATVTGAGSRWISEDTLSIGSQGAGSLSVEDGGLVVSGVGYLGHTPGGVGAVSVTGVGSTWTNVGELYVGGTLTVMNGGEVTANTLYAAPDDLHGDGTIAAEGAVLDTDLQFDAAHGTQQSLMFGTGGTLSLNAGSGDLGAGYQGQGSLRIADGIAVASSSGYLGFGLAATGQATVTGPGSTWANNSALVVGSSGAGMLRVEEGAQVTSASGYLGRYSGGIGDAIVTGPESLWSISQSLYVGGVGSGSLTVEGGAEVTSKTIFASLSDLDGDGTITATGGAVLDANLTFDAEHGNQQIVSFGTGGILNVLASGGALGTGYKHNGSLCIRDGIQIDSSSGYLGYHFGAVGSAMVFGSGSQWNISSRLFVGGGETTFNFYGGNGTLQVEAGGQVASSEGYVGTSAGAIGLATITGQGSRWSNSLALYIGGAGGFDGNGSGMLRVETGGEVNNDQGYLGYTPSSFGEASITGLGSQWINRVSLHVGRHGRGELVVADGGYVYSRTGYISASSTASGSVTVTGPDSQWVNATSLYVAQSGEGRLTIANSGLVRVGGILGVFGSKGAVNLATGGMLALSGDADDSLSQFLGLVQGTDAIRYWNDTLAAWAPLTSATFGVDYTLEYQITGDLAGYTLLTVGTLPVLDGDFNVDGVVDAADYTVWRDGLDTIYTQADYDLWKANFGNTYPEFPAAALAPNSVPEPSTVWLGALCVAVAHRGIRGRMGMHQGCLSRP